MKTVPFKRWRLPFHFFLLIACVLAIEEVANGTGIVPVVPTVSIRAVAPETREPFCDPAVCDAAPPPPGVVVLTRRGGDLTKELSAIKSYAASTKSSTVSEPGRNCANPGSVA